MRNKRGFTLIEILVVIIIVSITASVALLSFGDFGASRQARVSAEQFVSYIKLVQQRALMEMKSFGIKIEKNGYAVYRYSDNSWQTLDNNLFRWRAFPKHISVRFINHPISKGPDIIINATGDMTPFKLSFGTEAKPDIYFLVGSLNGELIIQDKAN